MQPQNNNPYNQQPYQMPMMPPPPMPMPQPMGRRQRWNRRLMSGAATHITTLPSWFATYAVASYAIALVGVNLMFYGYAMEWYFWLFGIVWVAGFFFLSLKFSQEWSILHIRKQKTFEKKLFQIGFAFRVLYAIFIYYFYIEMTGVPHEFASADSTEYIHTAEWLAEGWEGGYFWDVISEMSSTSFSDMGFPLYILLPVRIFKGDEAVFLILIINALIGAHTSVIIYRLVRRSMSENTARLAAIFCMLHPVLICYVGLTLKEVVMTWLLVLFIDLADRMLVGRRYTFATIAPLALTGFGLFMFRTVLGLIAIMAVFFALAMMDTKIVGWGKKIILGAALIGAVILGASDNIMREVEQIRDTDVSEQQEKSMNMRYGEGKKSGGNTLAKYAGSAVFAPLIFTIPFPTMVATEGQEDMRLIHGGNWMRNVMSGFVILAMFMLLLSGDWRKYTLPLAMLLGYLVMLVFTQYAHSLRFHIPVMPFEMIFAAYAITNMRKKHRNWYLIWCLLCIVMCFGWNWFKLAGRGI